MPTHSLKARALFLCLTLWLAVTPVVYAGGQPEARLADAEKLIKEQDYSAALKLLAAIQRGDPNLRDATSRLMEQVIAVTQRYNVELEALNAAIEAGDVEKMQKIIPVLHQIDPRRAEGLTGQAEVLIGFLTLMNTAQGLLRQGKAADALALYLLPLTDPAKAGFTLPESPFEGAGYGQIITSTVKRSVSDIVAASQEQLRAAAALRGALPAAKVLLSGPSAAAVTAQDQAAQFDSATAPLLQAAAAEGRVRSGASTIGEIGQSTRRSSSKGREDLYLRYLQWLCLGRGTRSEGIAYALRQFWADDVQQAAEAAGAAAATSFESARSAYESGGLAAADVGFQDVPAKSLLAAKAAALVSARLSMDAASGAKVPGADFQAMKDALGISLAAEESAAEAQAYGLLISYRKDLDGMPSFPAVPPAADSSTANLSAESAKLASARASIAGRTAEAQSQDASWTARGKSWESMAGVVDAAAPLAESANHVAALFRSFADTGLRSRDVGYALRIAAIGGAAFPKRLKTVEDMLAQAENFNPPGADSALKHPDQALPALAAAKGNLESLIADILAHEQKLQADNEYVKSSPEFAALFEGTPAQPGYDAILQSAQAGRARIDQDTLQAQSQTDAAALALVEGDKLFQDAQDAYASGDTKAATDNLNKSVAAYNRVLENEYSEHAKARTTKDFFELAAKINKQNLATITAGAQKNEAAIRDLINKPDYPAAKERLDAALAAWPSNLGTYQPYLDLQQQIQNGLAATQGLTFDRRDPRAEPVNALLASSQANLSASKLNEARQNVADALTVAPNYGAARVLELKISRQSDPGAFKTKADAQIAAYRKLAAESTNQSELNAVYRALLSYSSLDPDFKAQLAPLIQELRYKLGIDPRPATPDQIARADALLREARAIAQQGTEQAFQQASEKVAQVSGIIRSYPPAIALSQQIAAQRVAATPDQLGPAAQERYNQAWSLYLRGALNDAYTIVKDLWSNVNNQPYVPLQQLKAYLERDLHL